MKIGFDAKRLYNNFTGLGNYSRFVVDALDKFYPENKYFLFTPKITSNPETLSFLNAENIDTILPPAWVPTVKLGSAWRRFRIGHQAARIGVDIYHGLSQELPYSVPGNIRTLVTIHDLIFIRYPHLYSPIDAAIYKAKVKHACRVADKIISISEQTAQDLVDLLGVDRTKIQIINQGCHSNFRLPFSPQQLSEIKLKYKLPDEFILNVGTIESRKNTLLIAKALNILKGKTTLPLVLIGRGTAYLNEIKHYARENGLEDRIIYIHNIQFKDLPGIYRLAKVFVYPSLFEGFGIPIVEAITCNVPVITSTGSCFGEAAGPHSIYVDPVDAEALAHQLQHVLQDEEVRDNMISKSKLYIQKFQPDVIARNLQEAYGSVLKN